MDFALEGQFAEMFPWVLCPISLVSRPARYFDRRKNVERDVVVHPADTDPRDGKEIYTT